MVLKHFFEKSFFFFENQNIAQPLGPRLQNLMATSGWRTCFYSPDSKLGDATVYSAQSAIEPLFNVEKLDNL